MKLKYEIAVIGKILSKVKTAKLKSYAPTGICSGISPTPSCILSSTA